MIRNPFFIVANADKDGIDVPQLYGPFSSYREAEDAVHLMDKKYEGFPENNRPWVMCSMTLEQLEEGDCVNHQLEQVQFGAPPRFATREERFVHAVQRAYNDYGGPALDGALVQILKDFER